MKISQAIADFIAYQKARRGEDSGTAKGYEFTLRQFLRHTGDKQMASLTERHVEDWFYGPEGIMNPHPVYMGRGSVTMQPAVAPSTHNLYRTRMTVWMKWCLQRRYLTRDIMLNVQPMLVPKKKRTRHPADVLLRMLDTTNCPRDRALLATALNTALRASEITRLRVGDVDLDAGYLDVKVKKTGDFDETPITSDLDRELRQWLTRYATDLGRPLAKGDLLFPHNGGNSITHYETGPDGERYPVRSPRFWRTETRIPAPEKIVKKALEALGLESHREGLHTIRRSVARAYFDVASQEMGDVAALRETSSLLHHSSTATTEIYLGLDAEKNRRDRRMRGRPFLTAMISKENVVPLRAADHP